MSRVREVAEDIFQVDVLGARVTVLVDGVRVVLLDAGLRISSGLAGAFLAAQGFSFRNVSHILITHAHPDHVGGLARLQRASGALVAAHPLEAAYISGAVAFANPVSTPVLRHIFWPVARLLRPLPVPVDLPLEDGAQLDILGGLEVVHTPGHTAGSLSFYLPARGVLFVGDALQRHGGRLRPPNPIFTRDMPRAKASIRRLAGLEAETICFSHFPPILGQGKKELHQLADRVSA